ncbi:MAG: type II secretion system protein [Candidatus Liptonbacteria bacterium]
MFAGNKRGGQSLIEILVAAGVGVILISGAALVISPALKSAKVASRTQGGAALGRSLLDQVRTLGESDWHAVSALSTSTDSAYYINATSSPFSVATGTLDITLATTTFTIYFKVYDVHRDGSGNISGSGAYDPSTKMITAIYGAQNNATTSMVEYITRAEDRVIVQTDWSGQSGVSEPLSTPGNSYASSSNISGNTTPGSLEIPL